MLAIPGWQETASLDAVDAFHLADGPINPDALAHESRLPCLPGAEVDPSQITAPAYLYWGGADTTGPLTSMQHWAAVPSLRRATVYPGEGHSVQYRHWDQIMADMAGYTDDTVLCANGETKLVQDEQVDNLVAHGATSGSAPGSLGLVRSSADRPNPTPRPAYRSGRCRPSTDAAASAATTRSTASAIAVEST